MRFAATRRRPVEPESRRALPASSQLYMIYQLPSRARLRQRAGAARRRARRPPGVPVGRGGQSAHAIAFYRRNGLRARRRAGEHRALGEHRDHPHGALGQHPHRREARAAGSAPRPPSMSAATASEAASAGRIHVISSASCRGSQVPVTGTTYGEGNGVLARVHVLARRPATGSTRRPENGTGFAGSSGNAIGPRSFSRWRNSASRTVSPYITRPETSVRRDLAVVRAQQHADLDDAAQPIHPHRHGLDIEERQAAADLGEFLVGQPARDRGQECRRMPFPDASRRARRRTGTSVRVWMDADRQRTPCSGRRRNASGVSRPLIVLLHGYGSHEGDLFSLSPRLPLEPVVASLRAPLPMGPGFAWWEVREPGCPTRRRSPSRWMRCSPGWTTSSTPRCRCSASRRAGRSRWSCCAPQPERFTAAVCLSGFVVPSEHPGDAELAHPQAAGVLGPRHARRGHPPAAIEYTLEWLPGARRRRHPRVRGSRTRGGRRTIERLRDFLARNP